MTRTWRQVAAPIIFNVLRETEGRSEREIRKALRAAYPFGERKHFPYKTWLDEIRHQRGMRKTIAPDPRQMVLLSIDTRSPFTFLDPCPCSPLPARNPSHRPCTR